MIPEHIYGDGQDPNSSQKFGKCCRFRTFQTGRICQGSAHYFRKNENFFLEGKPILTNCHEDHQRSFCKILGRENGEIHLSAFESTPQDILHSKGIAHLTATDKGYAAIGPITWLAFNTKSKPTSDVRVRQAIAYAVDRNFFNQCRHEGNLEARLHRDTSGQYFSRAKC